MAVSPKLSSKLEAGQESPPSSTEKTQQHQTEGTAPEAIMNTPEKITTDPDKPALGIHTSDTAPAAAGIAENPTGSDDFGREDKEYISGYKLFAALFGIVSVFFIVLLDFSIIATVSMYNRWILLLPHFLTSSSPQRV
jgi:hypothetical protein